MDKIKLHQQGNYRKHQELRNNAQWRKMNKQSNFIDSQKVIRYLVIAPEIVVQ
jgi:hypothetical protein